MVDRNKIIACAKLIVDEANHIIGTEATDNEFVGIATRDAGEIIGLAETIKRLSGK